MAYSRNVIRKGGLAEKKKGCIFSFHGCKRTLTREGFISKENHKRSYKGLINEHILMGFYTH